MRLFKVCLLLLTIFALPTLCTAQNWTLDFSTLMKKGMQQDAEFDYKEAAPFFKEAYELALLHQDSSSALKALFELARSTYHLGNIDHSRALYKTIESNFSTISLGTQKGLLYNQLSLISSYKGDKDSSAYFTKIGIEQFSPEEDSALYALLYDNWSSSLLYLGKYQQGVDFADSALKYAPISDLYRKSNASIKKYIGLLWLGKTNEAEPFLLSSLENAEKLNDPELLTSVYNYAGDYYSKRNDLNKALIYFQKGLEISTITNNDRYTFQYHSMLGELFMKLENPDRAITHFNIAHQYYEQGGNDLEVADQQMNLAECFLAKGNLEQAEKLLLQAHNTFLSIGNKRYIAQTTTTLTSLYLEKGDPKTALQYLEQSEQLGRETDGFWILRSAQNNALKFDDTFVSAKEKTRLSKQYYQEALKLEPSIQLKAQTILASTYHKNGSDSAFILAELSFAEIEKRRVSLSGGVLKATAFSDFSTFYNEVGNWYATDKKNYGRAFELFEQSKARALLDELAEAQSVSMVLAEEDQIQLLQLQKQIDQLFRTQENLHDVDEQVKIEQKISSLQLKYDALLEELKSQNPIWSSFVYPDVLSLEDVQELCDNNTAIIEYAFTYSGLAIMIITKNDIHYQYVDGGFSTKQDLKVLIDTFRNHIIDQKPETELKQAAAPIFDLVFAPAKKHLTNIQKLVIVPDGQLNLLPFDALFSNGEYLTKQYTIKLMPSISVFNSLPNPHRLSQNNLIAVAGSGFEAGDGLFGINSQTAFATLPYTLIEVDSIALQFEHTKVLKNEQVTEASLKKLDISTYKYVHFATHGAINEVAPSQSGLILSKKIQVENLFGEDGYLNASEISQLTLNADLVVLSSCNTATGKVISGEGLLGLQRSFLSAGASSVVASLWSIYDRSTPIFMSHFYEHLNNLEETEFNWYDRLQVYFNWHEPELVDYKAMALQRAKLDMMQHPYYNHPVHWASFVITGK